MSRLRVSPSPEKTRQKSGVLRGKKPRMRHKRKFKENRTLRKQKNQSKKNSKKFATTTEESEGGGRVSDITVKKGAVRGQPMLGGGGEEKRVSLKKDGQEKSMIKGEKYLRG